MGNLLVATFNDQFGADQALIGLMRLSSQQQIELEDVVVVTKTAEGRAFVKQSVELTPGRGAVAGSWLGLLVGLILGGPLGGVIGGAAIGALVGKLTDIGVDNKFIDQISQKLANNSSAIFILSKSNDPAALKAELDRLDAEIMETDLPEQVETTIKDAMEEDRADVPGSNP